MTLELGGKSANIVFDGANLEEAAKWAAFGVYENMGECCFGLPKTASDAEREYNLEADQPGQSCSAGSRVLVQDSIYDAFIPLFVKASESFKVGPPADEDTFQGPQVSKVQFEKILGYIESGKKSGAKLLTGGGRHGSRGYYVKPTVFGDVTMDMQIGQEEIFGPVASLIRFKDEDEAVAIANASEVRVCSAFEP